MKLRHNRRYNGIDKILSKNGFEYSDKTVEFVNAILNRVANTIEYFKFTHENENDKLLREFNTKVEKLLQWTAKDRNKIVSLSIQVKGRKKPIVFHNDALSRGFFLQLFGGPIPDMTLNGDFEKQVNYLTSSELFIPVKKITHAKNNQLFSEILNCASPLNTFLFKNGPTTTQAKGKIKALVISLLEKYFEEIPIDGKEASVNKAFTIHFFNERNLTPLK